MNESNKAVYPAGIPPQNIEVDAFSTVSEILKTGNFYGDDHKIIGVQSILRRLISPNIDIVDRCFEEHNSDTDLLVDRVDQAMVEQRYKKKTITGVPTGYVEIDRMTKGLQPSDFIIIAARPSMGKTSFAMDIAQHAALVEKTGVAIFSLEMTKEKLVTRLLSSLGRIDFQVLRDGKLRSEHLAKLAKAVRILAEAPLFIDDSPAISVMEVREKIRRLVSLCKIGLVIVDYLQLMRGGNDIKNQSQEMSEMSRSLKAMAEEQNIPVIALSQLNRSVENRTDKRPVLSDLCEFGTIEQDADLIFFIYRDEVYNKARNNSEKGVAEVIIGKQRNGPIGLAKMSFVNEFTLFENMVSCEKQES